MTKHRKSGAKLNWKLSPASRFARVSASSSEEADVRRTENLCHFRNSKRTGTFIRTERGAKCRVTLNQASESRLNHINIELSPNPSTYRNVIRRPIWDELIQEP